ncbi:MAG: Hsp70 protein [Faunusvirus sp.]|jgi:heat shock protein 1/8|uniref:Hsp70 protein n=1 Tax=Faunusvirus sp. TaxID=2487766 RepID=A0A3G4ZXQ0_9VIRU|nr:MAG: Hsp70 protein [Faunusvirus sp.]
MSIDQVNDIKIDNVKNDIVIGIDLGTTNSCVAIWRNRSLEIITDKHGRKTLPSIVAFTKSGRITGHDAKTQIEKNPRNTIYDIKRLIGKNFNDESVQNSINFFTYDIVESTNGNLAVKTKYTKRPYAPEEISAMILTKLKKIAQDYVYKHIAQDIIISKAVITIPAYFNDAQRQATKDAATIAGLDCIRLLNEPTAAALAYGLNNRDNCDNINVIVYDFGGGTLDVSLLNIDDGIFTVIATTGNTHLGGEDIDECLYNYIIAEFATQHKMQDVILEPKNVQKLRVACERAKVELSTHLITTVNIERIYQNIDLKCEITRDIFERVCKPLFEDAMKPLEEIMLLSQINIKNIDEVILVGGTTRIPKIQFMLSNYFNKQPCTSVDPDYVVATGAAIQGYMLCNLDDPFCNEMVLLDVTPLSLGIESMDGIMATIIEKNTTIPHNKTKHFTTTEDNAEDVEIKIYEGERKLTKDNFHIGTFILKPIEKAPKGVPVILVTFNVDVNGIISVTAEDKRNKSKSSIVVSGNKRRLTQEQIEQLVREANSYECEDMLKQRLIELFHDFKRIIDMIEYNVLKNAESKFDETDKQNITDDLMNVNKYLLASLVNNKYYEFQIIAENTIGIDNITTQKLIINDKLFDKDTDDKDEDDKKYNFIREINMRLAKKIKFIKKKYAQLVLQLHNADNMKVKSHDIDVDNFDDVGDEPKDDVETVTTDNLDKLFSTSIQDVDINQDTVKEKQSLLDVCASVNAYMGSDKCQLLDHNRKKLAEYIDNILIWVRVNATISQQTYIDKVNEVNKNANYIIKINGDELDAERTEQDKHAKQMAAEKLIKKTNYKNELIVLCNSLIQSITSKKISLSPAALIILNQQVLNSVNIIQTRVDLDTDNIAFKHEIDNINALLVRLLPHK